MKPQDLIGRDVYDPEGERIGRVGMVYVDGATRQPQWVTVRTGLFGQRESFVPLRDARSDPDGLRVGVLLAVVKDAPQVDGPPTDGSPVGGSPVDGFPVNGLQVGGLLSGDVAAELFRYYGLPDASPLAPPVRSGPKPSDMPRKRVH
ncbi:PRC-barrel domain-containing protein [Actinokineospora sp. 24-640]